MEAQLGPCLPPLSCHPGVEWTVPEVGLGLLFLLTGLVLGPRPHPHHPHQFEMASKTHLAKVSDVCLFGAMFLIPSLLITLHNNNNNISIKTLCLKPYSFLFHGVNANIFSNHHRPLPLQLTLLVPPTCSLLFGTLAFLL